MARLCGWLLLFEFMSLVSCRFPAVHALTRCKRTRSNTAIYCFPSTAFRCTELHSRWYLSPAWSEHCALCEFDLLCLSGGAKIAGPGWNNCHSLLPTRSGLNRPPPRRFAWSLGILANALATGCGNGRGGERRAPTEIDRHLDSKEDRSPMLPGSCALLSQPISPIV